MSKITRKAARLFGSTAGALDVSQFGSLAASNPIYSTDPDIIQALSNFLAGWKAAVIGSNSPTIEDMNALFLVLFRQVAYIFQQGLPEWDTATIYFAGGIATDTSGFPYFSLTNNNQGNALSDTTKWAPYAGFGSMSTTDAPGNSWTISSGKTLTYPGYIVGSGKTWTVNGSLNSLRVSTVLGTLITNGNTYTV